MTTKILVVTVLLPTACGCAGLERAGTAAVTPQPETGQTPIMDFVGGLVRVVTNPGDLAAWGQVLGAIVVVVAAGFGVKKVSKVRAARKEKYQQRVKEVP